MENNECGPAGLQEDHSTLARLHHGKVGERLGDFFRSVSDPSNSDDEWYGVPKALCHGYMMHLAESVALKRGIPKVTDSKDSFAVSPFYDNDGALSDFGYDSEHPFACAMMGLPTLVPKDAGRMPAERLIQFRQRTLDGRRAFAESIEEVAAELGKISDPQAAEQKLQEAAAEFARSREVIATQSTYSASELVAAVICVGVPVGAAVGQLLAGQSHTLMPVAIGAGTVYGLVASMSHAYSNRRQRHVSPARSYYVELESEVSRVFRSRYSGRGNDFWAVMEEFVND